MVDLKEMLKEAIRRTSVQPAGQRFCVKDLFTGTEWNMLDVGSKRQLGILYSKEYKRGGIQGIVRVENNKQHHNVFMKTQLPQEVK